MLAPQSYPPPAIGSPGCTLNLESVHIVLLPLQPALRETLSSSRRIHTISKLRLIKVHHAASPYLSTGYDDYKEIGGKCNQLHLLPLIRRIPIRFECGGFFRLIVAIAIIIRNFTPQLECNHSRTICNLS